MSNIQFITVPLPEGRDRGHNEVNTIVIHAMCEFIDYNGRRLSATNFLRDVGLSCHYMVTPKGSVIECANPRDRITWHAKGHNTNSIGIEVLVPDVFTYLKFIETINTTAWVKAPQFNSLIRLVNHLIDYYPIQKIVRHSDLSPERKADPGEGFEWVNFRGKCNLDKLVQPINDER